MPMDPKRKNALQVMLNKRLGELLKEIKSLESSSDIPVPVKPRRRGARVDDSDDPEAFLEIRQDALAKVRLAIIRLNGDRYGICIQCGTDIAESRLEALTFAVRCKNCDDTEQARREKEVAGMRGEWGLR